MRCPRCTQDGFQPHAACAACGFAGPPGQMEELGHIAYLLGGVETWHHLGPRVQDSLRDRYLRRREELEIDLGLRQPALTSDQARDLQWNLFCLGELEKERAQWVSQGYVHPGAAERLSQGGRKRIENLPAPCRGRSPARVRL